MIDLAISQRHLLRQIAVRQLLRNDHGTCRSDHAFDGAPADADEIRIDQGVRTVEPALVAAVRQSKVGQRTRRARPAGDDGVGSSRDDLERLASDGSICASVAFVRDDLDRGTTDVLHQCIVDKIAPGVAEPDVGGLLDIILFHALDYRGDHQGRRLWNGNEPLAVRILRLSGRRE